MGRGVRVGLLVVVIAAIALAVMRFAGRRESPGRSTSPVSVAAESTGAAQPIDAVSLTDSSMPAGVDESTAPVSSGHDAGTVSADPRPVSSGGGTGSAAPSVPGIADEAARLMDNGIPVERRREQIAALIRRGDAGAARVLMTVGQADTYLNDAAVEALGNFRGADVVDYLQGRLTDANPRVVAAAARSLAQSIGAEAIPVIATTLKENRKRPDGFENMVRLACVESLAETRSPGTVPVLAAELDAMKGAQLDAEYGSKIVTAIDVIGQKSAVPALKTYRAALEQKLGEVKDNPMGVGYIRGKIAEVTGAIEKMGG